MKIRDMSKCLEEFEQLCKAFLKSKNIVDKEGVPAFYTRLLADLEDYLNELWEDKEGKKKMNKNNAKALSSLRQKIRKYNRDYETEITRYRENPEQSADEEEEKGYLADAFIQGDLQILGRTPSDEAQNAIVKKEDKAKKKQHRKMKRVEEEEEEEEGAEQEGEGEWEKVKGGVPMSKEKPKMFAKGTEINNAVVLKKLHEILQARGKKGTDRFLEDWSLTWFYIAPFRVRGCMLTLVERMDEEFSKIMQNTDPHSQEYVDNLKDEARVCWIVDRLLQYLDQKGSTEEVCRVYLRRIMHTYYKFDFQSEQDQAESEGEDSAVLMDRLCKFIYSKDRTDRIRTCAILCHIYHHALHNRWYQARDLMLMSHLQDNIQHADPPVQILYNRTMVQLGICAFRQGMIKDAHNALLDIQSSGRAKELLGQGLLMRNMQERNPEQEKIEKRRQVPFHMHINLELLECVYLVSAMLLEIPYMAAHEFDARRRMISKQFHHQLRVGERQPLLGPPESMREHVVAASKAMKMGDWKTCHAYIINEKMNSKVWDLFPEAQRVTEMLVR
ncbi:UNVERIFIED_CONTAM: hypothetical protein FKN15_011068 [Acipenser sinensis]